LEPLNSGAHVLLSNLYAKMGRWADVRRVRGLMEAKGVKKTPGCAMVEIGGDLYEFLVGDRTRPETREYTYLMLEEIMRRLKAAGYVANTGEVLLDLDEEAKEAALAVHSEKLAIAFCFIRTAPGTALRVVKNLRVCVDCHTAIKLISEIYEREIVVRDRRRFHHFRHGSCSCADFCSHSGHVLRPTCGLGPHKERLSHHTNQFGDFPPVVESPYFLGVIPAVLPTIAKAHEAKQAKEEPQAQEANLIQMFATYAINFVDTPTTGNNIRCKSSKKPTTRGISGSGKTV
ncbi:hypothetical protein Taro_028146, partial [Colocasia esculenta]|nr:hypothetical protein [Colocasia esculenta]